MGSYKIVERRIRIMKLTILAIVSLGAVLGAWRIGYKMGRKDEMDRCKKMFNLDLSSRDKITSFPAPLTSISPNSHVYILIPFHVPTSPGSPNFSPKKRKSNKGPLLVKI